MEENPPVVAYFERKNISSCKLIEPTVNNRVIIRVWMPHVKGQESTAIKAVKHSGKGNDSNVGHTSIETADQYVSIWPHPTESVTNIFKLYKSKLHSLEEDEAAEGGPCDLTVCLYSLNVPEIESAFKEVKETNIGYVLTGDFSAAESGGQSCCGLTNALLRRGGIMLLGSNDSSLARIVTTPDGLARYVKEIKAEELERFKQTREYAVMDKEYIPPPVNRSSGCILV
jgi:hypothetical protein